MPRIRSIKPEFWSSEDIVSVSRDARLLFIGLWNFADDSGNGPGSPRGIKIKLFPGDDISNGAIKQWLHELHNQGLIQLYEVEDIVYYHVTGWEHQRIDKPQKSKYPQFQEHSKNIPRTLLPDRIGEDSKGKDRIGGDYILSRRKRKLRGPLLDFFNEFWDTFGDKRGRAEAVDAWIDINWGQSNMRPRDYFLEVILPGAKAYAVYRKTLIDNSQTPKMAQGWITGRRWEDEIPEAVTEMPDHIIAGSQAEKQWLEDRG